MSRAFHIEFGSIDNFIDHAKEALEGKVVERRIGRTAMFEDFDKFMSFLYPHKFKILLYIKTRKPRSIYELAKELKRGQPAVLKDCKELAGMNFISLTSEGPRKSLKPALAFDYDRIIVHAPEGKIKHILPTVA
ncbi:MAG: hypothetical protein HRU09_16455 [Oligoflexales bacterium]|nr:hypothetical protein [Oligoflexales bacterium]